MAEFLSAALLRHAIFRFFCFRKVFLIEPEGLQKPIYQANGDVSKRIKVNTSGAIRDYQNCLLRLWRKPATPS